MKSPYVKLDVERYDELIEIEKDYDLLEASLAENSIKINRGYFNQITVHNPTEQQKILCDKIYETDCENNELRTKLSDIRKKDNSDLDLVERRVVRLKMILGLSLAIIGLLFGLSIHLLLDL